MAKLVFVVSMDLPDGQMREFTEEGIELLRVLFAEQSSTFIWAGINGSAEAVLNSIGVD